MEQNNPHASNYLFIATFFAPPDEKTPKGIRFVEVEEVKEKSGESLKGIKIDKLKDRFKTQVVKKNLNKCIASNEDYFISDRSMNM